jgi:hypothetical protein
MITKKNLFTNDYVDLLSPETFEFLNLLIGQLGYNREDYNDPEVKKEVLNLIKIILDLDIITVHKWMDDLTLLSEHMTTDEIVKKIDRLWMKSIEYPDFYKIALFGPKDWYKNKLEKMGFTPTTNWKTFVATKIGDLEKWIEYNRPK